MNDQKNKLQDPLKKQKRELRKNIYVFSYTRNYCRAHECGSLCTTANVDCSVELRTWIALKYHERGSL
jgi:hypothetical protein